MIMTVTLNTLATVGIKPGFIITWSARLSKEKCKQRVSSLKKLAFAYGKLS